jgi:hypothetical protein
VALEGAQDLAADVVVRVTVVAHVEVGEVLVLHPLLVDHGAADPLEERPRLGLVADLERGLEGVRGLPVAVLAEEREAETLEGVAVAAVQRQGLAGGRLRPRPVPGLQRQPRRSGACRAPAAPPP